MKSFGAYSRTIEQEKAGNQSLLSFVDVFPETGKIYWNDKAYHKSKRGKEAGSIVCEEYPYTKIKYAGKNYMRHRIIFYYVHGYLPIIVDHKNGLDFGDCIDNLQESDPVHNILKKNKTRKSKTTTSKGVDYRSSRGKYRAQIRINGKTKHIGYYDTEEQASIAYEETLNEYQKHLGYD